jgi:excisionase family DNA binding protein
LQIGESNRITMKPDKITQTPLITIADAAAFFAVSKRTIFNWIKGGLLAAKKIGGVVRIRRADVEKLIGGAE